MVLIKPLALAAEKLDRAMLSAVGLQIVNRGRITWAKKAVWLRNVPITAVDPTPAQALVRYILGNVARQAKGAKGLEPNTKLPWGAYYVHTWWKTHRGDVEDLLKKLRKTERRRPTLNDIIKITKIAREAAREYERKGETEKAQAIRTVMALVERTAAAPATPAA